MRRRILRRHVGLPVKFAAYDGRTYWGKLTALRNRVAVVDYQVTDPQTGLVKMEATAYLTDLKRLEIA